MDTVSPVRRHSQSVAMTTMTETMASLTTPIHRTRSQSISAAPTTMNGVNNNCPPPLAAHLLASAKLKIKEIEDKDSTGFLHYMDDQVHDTWNGAKSVVDDARRLLYLHELPIEWQENEYVLSG